MKKIICYPYLRAQKDNVIESPWYIVNENNTELLREFISYWDYNTVIELTRKIVIKQAELISDCRLSGDASLRLAVVWRSTATSLTGLAFCKDLNPEEPTADVSIFLSLKGEKLGGSLELKTQVLQADNDANAMTELSPCYGGSILWEEKCNVDLEGNGSRFPVEVIDFSSASWLPSNAAWFLDWNSEDLARPLMGSLRLYINSTNPIAFRAVSTNEPSSEDKLILSIIFYEVGKAMIRTALNSNDFLESHKDFPDGSAGLAIYRLLLMHFPGETMHSLKSKMIDETKFDAMLQDRFKIFQD